MKTIRHLFRFLFANLFVLAASTQAATPPPPPAGHWEGAIMLPNMKLEIRVDLAPSVEAGAWSGTIDIPAQGLRGFKLADVAVEGSCVSFKMPGVPGDPRFDGKLNSQNSQLAGEFQQGPNTRHFTLEQQAPTAASAPARMSPPIEGFPGTGLTGHWQGSLNLSPAISLRLVLHVTADAAGALSATLDSLDQNTKDQPASSVTFADGLVRVEFAPMSARYEGKLSANGATLEGRWKQGAADLSLFFQRLAAAPEFSRPQEPKKPYPYQERSVNFPGGAAEVMLAGTLTIPSGPGPFPAVVLLGGSGRSDRDETFMSHRPGFFLGAHITPPGVGGGGGVCPGPPPNTPPI
jgi:hypothetical protein